MVRTRQASRQGRTGTQPIDSSLPYTLVHSVPPEVSVNGTKVDSKGLHLSLTIPLNQSTPATTSSRRSTSKRSKVTTETPLSPTSSENGARQRPKMARSPRRQQNDSAPSISDQDNATEQLASQSSTGSLRATQSEHPPAESDIQGQSVSEKGHLLRRRVRPPRCGVRGCMEDRSDAQVLNGSPKRRTAGVQQTEAHEEIADAAASYRGELSAELVMQRQVDLGRMQRLHIDELMEQQHLLQRQQWQLQNQQLLQQQQQIHQQHWLQKQQDQLDQSGMQRQENLNLAQQLNQQHQLQQQIVQQQQLQQQLKNLLEQSREIQEQQRQLQQLHNLNSPSATNGGKNVLQGGALSHENPKASPEVHLDGSLHASVQQVNEQFDDTHDPVLMLQNTSQSDKWSTCDSVESAISYGVPDEPSMTDKSSSSIKMLRDWPVERVLDTVSLYISSVCKQREHRFRGMCKAALFILLATSATAICILTLLSLCYLTDLAGGVAQNQRWLNPLIESLREKEPSPFLKPVPSRGRFFFTPDSSHGANSIQEHLKLFDKCSAVQEPHCEENPEIFSEGEFACCNDARSPMCVDLTADIAAQDRGGRVDYHETTGAPSPTSLRVSWILERFASFLMPRYIAPKSSESSVIPDDDTAASSLGSYFPYSNHLNDPSNLLRSVNQAYSFAGSKGQVTVVLSKPDYIYAVAIDAPAALADGRCPGAEPFQFSVYIQDNTSADTSLFSFLNPEMGMQGSTSFHSENSNRTSTDRGKEDVNQWKEVGQFQFGCDLKPSIQIFFLRPTTDQVVQASTAYTEKSNTVKSHRHQVSTCIQSSCWRARRVRIIFTANWGSAVTLVRRIRVLSCEGPGNPCAKLVGVESQTP